MRESQLALDISSAGRRLRMRLDVGFRLEFESPTDVPEETRYSE